jgi:ketosteroid isomerase-like protein
MPDPQLAAASALLTAISEYDANGLAALIAPEGCLIFPEHPVYTGPSGAAELIKELARNFCDFRPVPLYVIEQGDLAAVEWTCTITDFGGSQSRLDGCAMLQFSGGKIHRVRFYFRPEDVNQ